jgi:hypothetical protein
MTSKKPVLDVDGIPEFDFKNAIPSPFAPRVADDEDVQLGPQVKTRRRKPSSAVVAVRLPGDLLARLAEYAAAQGRTLSDVMREGAERLVGDR